MTVRKANKYAPDNTSHPGETLREMLAEREIVQRQFAKQIGIAPSYLCDFLQCRRGAAPRLALRLEKALGVSAEFWLTMQMHHDLAGARAIERKRYKLTQESKKRKER
jgi:HTH-type transcriptional regulator/antitoxin HigA